MNYYGRTKRSPPAGGTTIPRDVGPPGGECVRLENRLANDIIIILGERASQ